MTEATLDEQLGLRPGDVLAERYCVGRLIARGGMGYVVAATHRELGTPFAIKVLKVKFARDETYLSYRIGQVAAFGRRLILLAAVAAEAACCLSALAPSPHC